MREFRSRPANQGVIIEDQTAVVMPGHLLAYLWDHMDEQGKIAVNRTYGTSNVTAVLNKARLAVSVRREEMKIFRKRAGRPPKKRPTAN